VLIKQKTQKKKRRERLDWCGPCPIIVVRNCEREE
jgi:hypothetical protein